MSAVIEGPRCPERAHFPALGEAGFVYLDAAATTLVPDAVIDVVSGVYRRGLTGVHRGVHARAAEATQAYEDARRAIGHAVGAAAEQVVLGRGTTEALNVVARGVAESQLGPGDEVLVSALDHHAHLVSWQRAAARASARLVVAPVDVQGVLAASSVVARINARTRVVALPHVSNVTGAVLDAHPIARAARAHGALFVLDGAQAAPHLRVDVRELGCDAYAFGAHKVYGPNGVGALVASEALLAALPPLHGGGHMVVSVDETSATLASGPARHEAGTANVEGALGFAAGLAFLASARARGAEARERKLLGALLEGLAALPFVRVLGAEGPRVGIVSFGVDGAHPHDVASLLDGEGVAVRAGRMCAQPFFAQVGVCDALRVSLSVHSDEADLATFFGALERAAGALR